MRALARFAVVGIMSLSAARAYATPSLVLNGGFETVTNGSGEIVPGRTNGAYVTSAANWYSTAASANGGFPFLFITNNAVTGFGDAWDNGTRSLWGAANGGASTWDGKSALGGNFLVMDGAYHATPISQNISGLQIGTTYALTFQWGAAQWYGNSGKTTETLTASLGNQSRSTQTVNLGSQDFSGWMSQTFDFTYTGGSNVLSFLASGTPSGEPPMIVLDGVALAVVPEPATLALLFTALCGALYFARRRRHSA